MNQALTLPGIGDLVDGRFRIDRMLGEGGTSAVYEVVHVITEKRFAIKWLLPELALEDAAVDRFIHEARVGSKFAHPLAVQVFDICRANDSFYMLMELLQGESLQTRLERVGRLDVQAACSIVLTCADVLSAAHRSGIIHRDLKPANIFLCKESDGLEVPKLLDFGISTFFEDLHGISLTSTPRGSVIGTPLYMSPEQMLSRKVDPRTDIYSLGAVLYELVSGHPPYQADSYAELVVQVTVEARPVPLQELAPVDPQFAAVVAKAMALRPEDRFQTVEELIVALRPYTQPPDASSIRSISAPARPQLLEPLPRTVVTQAPALSHSAAESSDGAERQESLDSVVDNFARAARPRWVGPWAFGLALVGAVAVAVIPGLFQRTEPPLRGDARAGDVLVRPGSPDPLAATDSMVPALGAAWEPTDNEVLTGRAAPDMPEVGRSERSMTRKSPSRHEDATPVSAKRTALRRKGVGARGQALPEPDEEAAMSETVEQPERSVVKEASPKPASQVRIRRSDFGDVVASDGPTAGQAASAVRSATPPRAAVSRDDF